MLSPAGQSAQLEERQVRSEEEMLQQSARRSDQSSGPQSDREGAAGGNNEGGREDSAGHYLLSAGPRTDLPPSLFPGPPGL